MLHKTMKAYISVGLAIVIASAAVALIFAPSVAQATEQRVDSNPNFEAITWDNLVECYSFAILADLKVPIEVHGLAMITRYSPTDTDVAYQMGHAHGFADALAAEAVDSNVQEVATALYTLMCTTQTM